MNKKNLYIISDFNLWYGNTAGVIRINNYSKSIVNNRNDIDIYLISVMNFIKNQNFNEMDKNIYSNPLNESFNQKFGLKKVLENIIFSVKLFNYLLSKQKNISVLIYPSFNISFTLSVFLVLKLLNFKNIYYEVNEVRKYSVENDATSIKNKIINKILMVKFFIYEFSWKYVKGLICISKNISEYAGKYNQNRIIIPVLTQIHEFPVVEKMHQPFEIFFSGYISIHKENFMEFLLSLKKLAEHRNDWIFKYCGPVDFKDKVIIDRFIMENHLEKKMIYLGNLSHDKVVEIQKNASLLVLPRKNTYQNYYGFPTKVAEYSISGTPVMMTNTGVLGSFFRDGYNCFMPEGYTGDVFFEKLNYIMNLHKDELKIIAENAISTATRYFRAENYSEVFTDFLNLD